MISQNDRINKQEANSLHQRRRDVYSLAIGASMIRPDHASGDRRLIEILKMLDVATCLTYATEYGYGSLLDTQGLFERHDLKQVVLPSIGWRPCDRALAERMYDIALIEFWHVSERILPLIRQRQPWTSIVIDTVDVHFVRELASAVVGRMTQAEVQENKCRELAVYHMADAIVVVTNEDKQALQIEGIDRPIFVIPNIVPERPRYATERKAQLLFVGGFSFSPNVDGLLWFVRECWGLVRKAVPNATLTIVGSNVTDEIIALSSVEGIEVIGYVSDTGPYLDAAAVSVAPLRYGGGMKGKVCEAMAAGLPVVTTSVGIQGIPAIDGETVRIADDPTGFSEAVVWALENPLQAEAMGRRGRELISPICGRDAVTPQVIDLLAWAEARRVNHSNARRRWGAWATMFRIFHPLFSLVSSVGSPYRRKQRDTYNRRHLAND